MTVEILGLQLPGNPQNAHQELFFTVISPEKWIKEVPGSGNFHISRKLLFPAPFVQINFSVFFSVMTNSAQPFWIYLPYRRYNRHALHQQVKLLLRNGHGLFLGSWPTEASRGKPFVYEQISVSFKNQAFDPVCLCPAEQEQDILLRRIQLKLFLHNCG